MTINDHHEHGGHGRAIVYALVALLVGGIVILWSWNTVATDLLGHPEMEYRHALAIELLIISAGALLGLPTLLRRFTEN